MYLEQGSYVISWLAKWQQSVTGLPIHHRLRPLADWQPGIHNAAAPGSEGIALQEDSSVGQNFHRCRHRAAAAGCLYNPTIQGCLAALCRVISLAGDQADWRHLRSNQNHRGRFSAGVFRKGRGGDSTPATSSVSFARAGTPAASRGKLRTAVLVLRLRWPG